MDILLLPLQYIHNSIRNIISTRSSNQKFSTSILILKNIIDWLPRISIFKCIRLSTCTRIKLKLLMIPWKTWGKLAAF